MCQRHLCRRFFTPPPGLGGFRFFAGFKNRRASTETQHPAQTQIAFADNGDTLRKTFWAHRIKEYLSAIEVQIRGRIFVFSIPLASARAAGFRGRGHL
jgi:hypothetical protein